MSDSAARVPLKPIRRLRRNELPKDTVRLARFLIGKTVVHEVTGGRLSGRIVETEAYPVGDAAGHAFTGKSDANHSLFLQRGHAYVRFLYGSCWIFNVSSETAGVGAGVLIRALEPLEGIEHMMRHRGVVRLTDLARGPGRLTEALAIDKRLDGVDLTSPDSPIWLGAPARLADAIAISTRIGLTKEAHRRLRFYERGNPYVSGPLRLRN
jgi:DNA-3-methyladenine glycosylase